jgi:hypothetical protein
MPYSQQSPLIKPLVLAHNQEVSMLFVIFGFCNISDWWVLRSRDKEHNLLPEYNTV